MSWTVFASDVECGHCGRSIPADSPVKFVGLSLPVEKRMKRCATCAVAYGHATDVNWREIEAARAQIERDRQEGPTVPSLANTRPTPRIDPRRRPLTRASELADSIFDPKAAAAGDDK